MNRPSTIVNRKDVVPRSRVHGETFAFEGRPLALASGSKQLGCTLYTIAPGKIGFPAHAHHANEEAVYILSGTGSFRLDTEWHPVEPGDYVALLAGGPAHQLRNTGTVPLEYLCFSTMRSPEVVEYPDSGKVGVTVGGWSAPTLREIYKKGSGVDYFDGE